MKRTLFLILLSVFCACSNQSSFDRGYAAFTSQDYGTAFRYFQEAAISGNADAAYYLGVLYARGTGVPQSSIDADKWFRKAMDSYVISATNGDSHSQAQLCFMHGAGSGVASNYAEAYRWCEQAAKLGNISAQRNLVRFYEHGLGVPKDLDKARYWRSKLPIGDNSDAADPPPK